jgi:uncharacterized membrane protein YsdA (DUF1294 family)
MTGHFLVVGQATSVSKAATTGLTWFLLILAAAAGARLGWLAPIGIFVLYLLLHAGAAHGAVHVSDSVLQWVVIALVGGFAGWQLGGRSILRHIGEREYRNRLSSAKGISSIWKSWLGDGK